MVLLILLPNDPVDLIRTQTNSFLLKIYYYFLKLLQLAIAIYIIFIPFCFQQIRSLSILPCPREFPQWNED